MFKVGDYVEYIKHSRDAFNLEGEIGIITEVHDNNRCNVKLLKRRYPKDNYDFNSDMSILKHAEIAKTKLFKAVK